MKASEFCEFFDFTLVKENGYVDEVFYEGDYKYRATDDQGVFHDRYATELYELADQFGIMEDDYIFDDMKENGFEEPDWATVGNDYDYYKAAYDWGKANGYSEWVLEVIDCLINPEHLEE